MSAVKTFNFGGKNNKDIVVIKIPEVLDASYGMYMWPCGPVLAQYIWHNQEKVKGKQVLELGAGTALPGILAAKLGARVTLSDASHLPLCLENCHKSCVANGLEAEVSIVGVTWGQFSPELIQIGSVDVILGSDCFYDTKDFEDVIVTVAYLCDKNPAAEFWSTYQERSSDRTILPLLDKWNLVCEHVPLEKFTSNEACLEDSHSQESHTIHMMIIKKKKG